MNEENTQGEISPSEAEIVDSEGEVSTTPKASHISPGELLKEAREAKDMDVADVARDLHLDRATIVALEADDDSGLPAAIFVRGYLRSYAALVRIPADELVAEYDSRAGSDVPPLVVEQPSIETESSGRVTRVFWLLVVVIVIGALLWWYSRTTHEPVTTNGDGAAFSLSNIEPGEMLGLSEPVATRSEPEPEEIRAQPETEARAAAREVTPDPIVEEPVVETIEPEPTTNPDPTAAERLAALAGNNTEPEPEVTPTPAEVAEPVAASEPEDNSPNPVLGNDVLRLSFSNDSWVKVTDANGRVLTSRLVKSGIVRQVKGQAPFNVLLGYAEGVEVAINGSVFDHSRFQRSNQTARFTVSAE